MEIVNSYLNQLVGFLSVLVVGCYAYTYKKTEKIRDCMPSKEDIVDLKNAQTTTQERIDDVYRLLVDIKKNGVKK